MSTFQKLHDALQFAYDNIGYNQCPLTSGTHEKIIDALKLTEPGPFAQFSTEEIEIMMSAFKHHRELCMTRSWFRGGWCMEKLIPEIQKERRTRGLHEEDEKYKTRPN